MVDVVGVSQIAKVIGVSVKRASHLAQAGRFGEPYLEAGGRRYWRLQDIEAWLEAWDRKPGRPRKEQS